VTQEEIATRIGISRQTYSAIETGKREMSWTVFLALLAVFNNDPKTRELIEKIDGLSVSIEKEIAL
jgi:transcriptional regulator, pvuIIC